MTRNRLLSILSIVAMTSPLVTAATTQLPGLDDDPLGAAPLEDLVGDGATASSHLTGKKIYVDPGHGGSDPGACPSPGTMRCEETWVLDVGLRVRNILQNHGASVRMSRTTDVYVSPGARASDANAWGAHRFVSIHLNSNDGTPGTGTEILICGSNSNTVDMANKMQDEISRHLGTVIRSGSPKQRCDLTVLSQTSMSANLAEVAFINNNNDWAKIDTATERQSAACAIAHSITRHYGLASPCTH